MNNLDRNVNPNNEQHSLYDPWWAREEGPMAANDTPDLQGIERDELYFKWFYDECAKFQRGEPARVRHEGNVTYIVANEKSNGHDVSDLKSVPISVTFFPDQSALRMVAKNMTLYQLRDLILSANKASKGELLWLKLAIFGNRKSNKNCLRHNANTRLISGVELDYDAKVMTLDEAIGITQKARLRALLYTSANYTAATPKWRILLPTSKLLPPQMRAKLVARVNGLFGGIFDDASFTLSQAFYFGSVNHNPEHRAEITEGDFIDLRNDLDAGAKGRQGKKPDDRPPLEISDDDRDNPFVAYLLDEMGPQRPEQTEANQDHVWDALCHIPSNLIRTEWIKVGMALHWLQWVDDDGCDWGKEAWDRWAPS